MTHTSDARRLSRREFGRSTVATVGASLLSSSSLLSSTAQARAPQTPLSVAAAGPAIAPIRIGSNENPYGVGPAALAAFTASSKDGNRYPGASVMNLSARLAAVHAVTTDRILLTPGSGEILRAATRAFTSPTKSLVVAAPTFESPERTAKMIGAPIQAVPVTSSGAMDLAGMAARAAGAGMFFICNPNNPTGGVNAYAAIVDFVAAVRKTAPDALILIDEAYFEYAEDPGYKTAIPLTAQDPKILVSRTFSKIHGMAGLRVGYAIASPDTLAAMRPHLSQGALSGPSAAAALASLDDREHLAKQVTLNRDARTFTRQAFESAGFTVLPSHANFLMVDVKRDAAGFQALCREAGVQIARAFPPMKTYARISIGTMDEMTRATALMLPLLAAPASAARLHAASTPDDFNAPDWGAGEWC